MPIRKIQLIAGTTYTVSLPKDWVIKNKLKEQDEILLIEKEDKTLTIAPGLQDVKKLTEISINIDDYTTNIDQILFSLYYLGLEKIQIFSKKEIAKDLRAMIRKTLTHMSGTEISYEDKQKIVIRVLLDKSKVEITQTLYRISLIIELSITNILEKLDISEIHINENEIDRLYHLIAKIVSISLTNANILASSGIKHVSLIPSYFLISKRMEHIADSINHLSEHLSKNSIHLIDKEGIFSFVKSELARSMKHIMADFPKVFEKTPNDIIKKINSQIQGMKDKIMSDFIKEIVRYLIDVQEEIVNISFHRKLLAEKTL